MMHGQKKIKFFVLDMSYSNSAYMFAY